MNIYEPVLDTVFILQHYLPNGKTYRFAIRITKHQDSDGTRYSCYPNGTGIVIGPDRFNRLLMSRVEKPSPMPANLREALNLIRDI